MLDTTPTAALVVLAVTLMVASITDLRDRRIPNWLTASAAIVGLLLAAEEGKLGGALLAGVLAASPFLVVSLVRPEGMGMGDVKLAGVLGIFLGQGVWPILAVGLALAGLTGVLLSLGQRKAPSRTALPLAPFFAVGSGIALLASLNLLQ